MEAAGRPWIRTSYTVSRISQQKEQVLGGPRDAQVAAMPSSAKAVFGAETKAAGAGSGGLPALDAAETTTPRSPAWHSRQTPSEVPDLSCVCSGAATTETRKAQRHT